MKANEFIKIFGLDEAKRVVNYRDKHASRTHVYKFNKPCVHKAKLSGGVYLYTESYGEWSVSVDELKHLVESHNAVDFYGGLQQAREVAHSNCFEFPHRLLKAILDVESAND